MRTLTRTSAVAGVLLAGFLVAAPGAEAATTTVAVSNFKYSPTPVTIVHGNSVKWTNTSLLTTHTVTADSGAWSLTLSPSGRLGSTKTRTFLRAGTYRYHCKFHNMHGSVIVK